MPESEKKVWSGTGQTGSEGPSPSISHCCQGADSVLKLVISFYF